VAICHENLEDQGPGHKSDNFHLLLMLVNFTAVHEAKAFYTYWYAKYVCLTAECMKVTNVGC
jgi:hypothetical protein